MATALRVLLNSLRCVHSKSGDKIRAVLGGQILPQNYENSRDKVTQALLDLDKGDGLRVAGFKLGDILITGSDRREWVKAKDSRDREKNTIVSSTSYLLDQIQLFTWFVWKLHEEERTPTLSSKLLRIYLTHLVWQLVSRLFLLRTRRLRKFVMEKYLAYQQADLTVRLKESL